MQNSVRTPSLVLLVGAIALAAACVEYPTSFEPHKAGVPRLNWYPGEIQCGFATKTLDYWHDPNTTSFRWDGEEGTWLHGVDFYDGIHVYYEYCWDTGPYWSETVDYCQLNYWDATCQPTMPIPADGGLGPANDGVHPTIEIAGPPAQDTLTHLIIRCDPPGGGSECTLRGPDSTEWEAFVSEINRLRDKELDDCDKVADSLCNQRWLIS